MVNENTSNINKKNSKNINTKFYLGSLPGLTNKENISKFFNKFGKIVDIKLMRDKKTKKCSGFGFLTLNHEASAKETILGTHTHLGREIKIEEFLNGKNL